MITVRPPEDASSVSGYTRFATHEQDTLKTYADVTKEDVIGWIKSAEGETQLARMLHDAERDIHQWEDAPLPWDVANVSAGKVVETKAPIAIDAYYISGSASVAFAFSENVSFITTAADLPGHVAILKFEKGSGNPLGIIGVQTDGVITSNLLTVTSDEVLSSAYDYKLEYIEAGTGGIKSTATNIHVSNADLVMADAT